MRSKTAGALLLLAVLLLSGTSSLAFAVPQRQQCAQSITITSRLQTTGQQFSGMDITLDNMTTGHEIKTGYTPITFCVGAGAWYSLHADSYKSYIFKTWSYPPTSENPLNISISAGVQFTIPAYFA